MHQVSPLFAIFRAASTVIPLLPMATLTPSIQPNLGHPRTRPTLTSAINALPAIRYASIHSTCSNHLNTLWSALPASSLSIPALLRTSSFLTLSIHDTKTKLIKHVVARTFTFLLSAIQIPHASVPYNAVGTITPSYRHFFAFISYPLLFSTLQGSPRSIPLVNSLYHIPFTTSIRCHLRPVTKNNPLPLAACPLDPRLTLNPRYSNETIL